MPNVITLTVRLPEGLPADRFEQVAYLVADAAHRCTDWEDRAEWDIVQTDGKCVTVKTQDPRSRLGIKGTL